METCTYCGETGHWRPDCLLLRPARLTPDKRQAAILAAGVEYAQESGFLSLTRNRVAEHAGVTGALVTHYYPDGTLRPAIMAEAIRLEIASIVAEGLAARVPAAMAAPLALRQAAGLHLAGVV